MRIERYSFEVTGFNFLEIEERTLLYNDVITIRKKMLSG
jgi:hypothetical protein